MPALEADGAGREEVLAVAELMEALRAPGDVHRFRLSKRIGHEQHGDRFAVVVRGEEFLPRSVVIVAPTSRSARPASFRPDADIAGETTHILPTSWSSRSVRSTPGTSGSSSGTHPRGALGRRLTRSSPFLACADTPQRIAVDFALGDISLPATMWKGGKGKTSRWAGGAGRTEPEVPAGSAMGHRQRVVWAVDRDNRGQLPKQRARARFRSGVDRHVPSHRAPPPRFATAVPDERSRAESRPLPRVSARVHPPGRYPPQPPVRPLHRRYAERSRRIADRSPRNTTIAASSWL